VTVLPGLLPFQGIYDMTDETTPSVENPESTAAVAEVPLEEVIKLEQTVEIKDVGPCKKHIKVIVNRAAIDERFNDKYTELVRSHDAPVKGFRPGKAPRKIIERRFKSAVEEDVRREVLMASLEQLATDHKITPLSAPELATDTLEIPDEGPFTYEFDVEVRPEFELPEYKGLKLNRLTKTFTPQDIAKERQRLLEPMGQLVPKEGDGAAELGDYLMADVEVRNGDTVVNTIKEVRVKVEKQLALDDGLAEDFGKTVIGSKAGDERDVVIKLSESTGNPGMRGKTITARFKIHDVKFVRQPELTPLLLREFGVRNEDQFEELLGAVLEKRLEYTQRQSYRQQILGKIAEASAWELPEDLLKKQAKRALTTRVMEMRNAGMSDEQIMGRRMMLEQDVVRSTAASLREHFVLQKIAEIEKIEIDEADIDLEIDRIADQSKESPRKVRARMERDGLLDALATQILERQALDLVLQNAEYEDVALKTEDEEEEVATVSAEAAPGQEGDAPQG